MAQKSNLPLLQSRQKQQIQTHLLPLPKDTAWMDELFVWADENKISDEQLPRNKKIIWINQKLDLEGNKLTEVPEAIAKLTNLRELSFQDNQLKALPESLGNLTALAALYLNGNQLTEIPEVISKLTNLQRLDLNNNQLTNLPEFLSHLTSLDWLALEGNQLTKIPNSIGRLTNLRILSFGHNKLTNVSEFIGDLISLRELYLEGNQLTEVPSSIGKLINLNELYLRSNKLTKLPESLGNLTSLTNLILHDNQLTELPQSLGNLTSLTDLALYDNQLTALPKSFGNLTNLTGLVLKNNQLKTLPESFGNLVNLTALFLHENQLTALPKFFGNLTNLTNLALKNNQLKTLPESFANLKNLKKLWLDECVKIPKNVLTIPNLKIIKDPLTTSLIKTNMKTYQQKILFGSPGTGKSYQIDKHIIPYELLIDVEKMPANVIKTVFHPEYTYGDFVGKLMPITVGGNVQYKFYEGHFLKALSQAYKNIIAAQDNDSEVEKVALVIDEINRGNSAAIFGTIFQLLDREPDGWSSYEVSVNEIIFNRLLELCDLTEHANVKGKVKKVTSYLFGEEEIKTEILQKKLLCHFENRTIKIPPNLSILASMNTSDSSIYYMDSAFKRRWEWEFIDVDSNTVSAEGVAFENRVEWQAFVSKLNAFIKSNHKSIRGIEDKQIGHFFITDDVIQKSSIQNKLMFFLWDSVFNRDKKPLIDLLFGKDTKHDELPLITFGDFATQVDLFIEKIDNFKNV